MRRRSQPRASGRSAGLSARPHTTASSGNVFRDLGFSREEAAHLLVRADLLIQVQKAIASSGLKQAEG
jgi:predicted XRE-type DNA-binding protein